MTSIQGILRNINFVGMVLLSFLMVYYDNINIPSWMIQSGRLHVALLHLPIGMFFCLGILIWIKKKNSSEELNRAFDFVLYTTVFTTIVAALLGIFLSTESDTYDKSILQWHRYTGYLFAISLYLYQFFFHAYSRTWQVALYWLIAMVICAAGHEGASITHGSNYLFSSNTQGTTPAWSDNSTMYDALIYPILSAKCISCHSTEKTKGNLIMTNSDFFKKGGKSGKAFIPGDLANSRLIQNVLLPIDDSLHMSPKGKPQLTKQEILALRLWIKGGASFTKRVNEYTDQDTLKSLLTTKTHDNVYRFKEADPAILSQLNNPWRSVKSLNEGSPAVAVNYILSSGFEVSSIKELEKIKDQLVFLNLTKMPISDQDLARLAPFQVLEKLNLNNTPITSLSHIASLSNLVSLSLSNTKIDDKLLNHLSKLPKLSELYLANTNLSDKALVALKEKYKHIRIVTKDTDTKKIKLSPPSIKDGISIYNVKQGVVLSHPIKGVKIHYMLGGKKADSTSTVYNSPILIDSMTKISMIARSEGWLASDEVTVSLTPQGLKADSVVTLSKPDPMYLATEITALNDFQKANFGNMLDPRWTGHKEENLDAVFYFKNPQVVSKIYVSYLHVYYASKFPPKKIEVYAGNSRDKLTLIKSHKMPPLTFYDVAYPFDQTIKINNTLAFKYYRVVCYTEKSMPKWNGVKGKPALVLVDEILFYN